MVEGDGFEPSKAEPADLQSAPFGHSGTPPGVFLFFIRISLIEVFPTHSIKFFSRREEYGGGGRIRTIEGGAGRFTVCSLWPLGNPSRVLKHVMFPVPSRECGAHHNKLAHCVKTFLVILNQMLPFWTKAARLECYVNISLNYRIGL